VVARGTLSSRILKTTSNRIGNLIRSHCDGPDLVERSRRLVVDARVVPKTGTGERDATISLVAGLPRRRVTIGVTKGRPARNV
jgi:hypothetical protein